MLKDVPLTEVMNAQVEIVEPETKAIEIGKRLTERGIGSVVVVDETTEEACGIVTQSDLVDLLVNGGVESATAADCHTSPVISIGIDASITQAARVLRENGIKKLPVCSDGELAGIITTTDLASYLPRCSVRTGASDRTCRPTPEMAYSEEGWQFNGTASTDSIAVGDTVEFSKQISDSDVRTFAELSGDTNRLHLDEEFAAQSRFGHRISHGALVAGLISAALARIPGLTIYLSQEISYLGPVDIDEQVSVVCEIIEKLDANRYRLSTDAYNESEQRVLEGEAVVLLDKLP